MDYVYICRKGENEELRYSIRSVFKYAKDPRIILFGNKPSWYTGEFIPIRESKTKFSNIYDAMVKISESDLVGEKFVLMNDDFFLLEPFDPVSVYHGGLLADKIYKYKKLSRNLVYVNMLQQTYTKLINIGIDNPLDYDIHVPFPMFKSKLKETIKHKTLYRSTYGNLANVGGIEIKDVKVYHSGPMKAQSFDYANTGAKFISSLDDSFQTIFNDLLKDRLPYASPVERAANV